MKKIQHFLKYFGRSIGVLGIYIALSILTGAMLDKYINSKNFWIANISGIISELIVLIVLFIIYHKKIIGDFKDFKKSFKKVMNIGFKNWLCGLIVMFASNITINLIVGNIASNEELNRSMLLKTPIYAITAMIIIAPIIEEIVFRLAPKKAFTKKMPYIIYSGLLFGGLHLLTSSSLIELLYIIPYSALGMAFAKSFYESDNIFASITTHMLHNTLAVAIAYLTLLG